MNKNIISNIMQVTILNKTLVFVYDIFVRYIITYR